VGGVGGVAGGDCELSFFFFLAMKVVLLEGCM
jgi:hypothetical protein